MGTETGYKIGHARVSTFDQDVALQRDVLQNAGCELIVADKASGKPDHRPGLDSMVEQLRPGDTVAVRRLDRLDRSLRNLIETRQRLQVARSGVRQSHRLDRHDNTW